MISLDDATHSDISQLCDLLGLLFTIETEFMPDLAKQRSALNLLVGNPQRGRVFVLRNGSELLGMVSVQFLVSTVCGGDVLLLEDLIIRPEFRNRGYGSALLEHAVEFARGGGYRRITLLTDNVNAGAQRFYTRHGFVLSHMTPYRIVI